MKTISTRLNKIEQSNDQAKHKHGSIPMRFFTHIIARIYGSPTPAAPAPTQEEINAEASRNPAMKKLMQDAEKAYSQD
jgi:hypothetical protein